jgi:hypothetical protein
MLRTFATLVAVTLALGACRATLPTCLTLSECSAHDGKRVAIVGVYTPFLIGPPKSRGEGSPPIRIAVADDEGPLLAPFWHEKGVRPKEEIDRYSGKRVRVVGIFHKNSPPPPDSRMATVGGPCFHPLESIELAE